jgi:hypothetical protein
LIDEPQPGAIRLKRDCLTWIRTTDYVSFAELERWLSARGVDVAGDHTLEVAPNVIVWAGVSERFCGIFGQMRGHLDLVPCSSIMVYVVDGKMLDLPIAKRPPRGGYAKPRWPPVTLRTRQRPTQGEIRASLIEEAQRVS